MIPIKDVWIKILCSDLCLKGKSISDKAKHSYLLVVMLEKFTMHGEKKSAEFK